MKNKLFAILRTLGITTGLNVLLLAAMLLFSHMVHRVSGQALLLLCVSLLLTVAVCLFAAIPAEKRSTLWACLGIAMGLHLILSIVVTVIGGLPLSKAWPGQRNLAWLLVLLLSLTAWSISVFIITAIRSNRLGKAVREEKRQVKRAKKGYEKKWQTLSPARARLLAILRGSLPVLWSHLLTGLLFVFLYEWNLASTMLSYIIFPTLWCLSAAAYGLYDREHRVAYTLSAVVSSFVLFTLPTLFLVLSHTPDPAFRFSLYMNSILADPFHNPEQMLAVGVFLSVWIAMLVFGVAHRKHGK